MLEISALRAFGDDGYIVGRDVVPENLIDSARPWLTDCSQNNRRQTSTMGITFTGGILLNSVLSIPSFPSCCRARSLQLLNQW